MLLRFIIGVFIVLHGLVHLLYVGQSQRLFELRSGMVWPDGSWAFSRLLGDKATRWLASITYVLAASGFVAGGIGILLGQAWWNPVVVGSAAFSAVMIALFWNGKIQRLADQGLIAVLINAAILVAVLVLRPPVVGTVGRESGQVRLRVVHHTDQQTLVHHVHTFIRAEAVVFTDEWQGYNHIIRTHATVCHGQKEWAQDDDDDGIRKVHVNITEGMWTTVRYFLRPFRGVHKKYLSGYVAMCEFGINLKRITPAFISALVAAH